MPSTTLTTAAEATKIQCTYSACHENFDSEKQMRDHKVSSSNHHYCKKCDYDALSWDDMLTHKVEAMKPFIVGDRKNDKHKKLKHLCCEFCGEDFKTMEGRMAHRRQMHQAPQHIVCQGNGPVWDAALQQLVHDECGQVFMRPSDFIEHYERGNCLFIGAKQFHAERQHLHIVKQILADPDTFSGNLCASQAVRDADEDTATDSTSGAQDSWTKSSASGGVDLLDHSDAISEASGIRSLLPRVAALNFMDQSIDEDQGPVKPHTVKAHVPPHLQALSASRSCTSTRAASPDGRWTSSSLSHLSCDGEQPRLFDDTSSSGSASTIRPSTPSPRAPSELGMNSSASIKAFIQALDDEPLDWTARCLSKSISPDMDSIQSTGYSSDTRPATTNILQTPWYDPSAQGYDPNIFYHPLLQKYKCPFAQCDYAFDEQSDMEHHLRHSHVIVANKCSVCNKEFKNVAGLMRHFESSIRGSKCWIANTKDFDRLLKEITGGLLLVGRTKTEKIVRHDDEAIGVKELVFSGTEPEKWQKQSTLKIGKKSSVGSGHSSGGSVQSGTAGGSATSVSAGSDDGGSVGKLDVRREVKW